MAAKANYTKQSEGTSAKFIIDDNSFVINSFLTKPDMAIIKRDLVSAKSDYAKQLDGNYDQNSIGFHILSL